MNDLCKQAVEALLKNFVILDPHQQMEDATSPQIEAVLAPYFAMHRQSVLQEVLDEIKKVDNEK